MGMFDTVMVPCPSCGEVCAAQSKGGECMLANYELDEAPANVLMDVNRHGPFKCEKCGEIFRVEVTVTATAKTLPVRDEDSEDELYLSGEVEEE